MMTQDEAMDLAKKLNRFWKETGIYEGEVQCIQRIAAELRAIALGSPSPE